MRIAARRAGALARLLLGGTFCSGSACAVPQSEACADYVECQAHFDDVRELPPTETNIYEPEGTCWETESLADDCSEACEEKMERLREELEGTGDEAGPCAG